MKALTKTISVFLLLLLPVVFVACSDDDEKDTVTHLLNGKWESTSASEEMPYNEAIEFQKNGWLVVTYQVGTPKEYTKKYAFVLVGECSYDEISHKWSSGFKSDYYPEGLDRKPDSTEGTIIPTYLTTDGKKLVLWRDYPDGTYFFRNPNYYFEKVN